MCIIKGIPYLRLESILIGNIGQGDFGTIWRSVRVTSSNGRCLFVTIHLLDAMFLGLGAISGFVGKLVRTINIGRLLETDDRVRRKR